MTTIKLKLIGALTTVALFALPRYDRGGNCHHRQDRLALDELQH
jgi:hypothetical protein